LSFALFFVLVLNVFTQEQKILPVDEFTFDCTSLCGKDMSCYGKEKTCVPQICTKKCSNFLERVPLNIDPNDWQDYVSIKEIFSVEANSNATIGDCGELKAFRHNVVNWKYNVKKKSLMIEMQEYKK